MKKNCKKLVKKKLEYKKKLKQNVRNCLSNGKDNDNSFNSWINKKDIE